MSLAVIIAAESCLCISLLCWSIKYYIVLIDISIGFFMLIILRFMFKVFGIELYNLRATVFMQF